jgi:hypothetical protein
MTPISEGPINSGYGEYYVFDRSGSKVSKNIYDLAYEIFDKYSLASIANSPSTKDEIAFTVENRFQIVKDKIKAIDPNLEVGFIPRCLYELIFIRKCLREDIREGERCKHAYKGAQRAIHKHPEEAEEIEAYTLARKCWHVKSFGDEYDNQNECVRNYCYRMNKAIVKALEPKVEGLTYHELTQKVQNEIHHLENFYQTSPELYGHFFDDDLGESVTLNVSPEANCFMGIKSPADAQIILNALAVECSHIAQTSFLLYRGAKEVDSIFLRREGKEVVVIDSMNGKELCYGLSYGTGLYAGCVFDSTATAFYYMRKEDAKAFVIPVPYEMFHSSPFYIPPTNTMTQLLGTGENFHAMTKKWKNSDYRFDFSEARQHPEVVESELEKQDLSDLFQEFSRKAIPLNRIFPET